MSNLSIRKKSINTWLHTDSVFGDFIISKFYFNSFFAKFQIVEEGNARLEQYEIANITLYDDTDGGVAETFTNITELSLRLEELQYPAFDRVGTSVFPSMEQITNVNVTDVEDGQVLAWDVAISKWVNITIGSSTTPTLQQVTDEGNITNTPFGFVDGAGNETSVISGGVTATNGTDTTNYLIDRAQYNKGGFSTSSIPPSTPIADVTFEHPAKAEATYYYETQSEIINANTTAQNDSKYTVIANATFTDPTPVEGKGYTVFVRNGTATIGGVGYTAGSYVFRFYQGGAWGSTSIGGTVPDADASTKGIAKLYTDLLASNTDGSVHQSAIVSGLALKQDKPQILNLTSDYTLTSSTSAQKLFNVGTGGNGAFDATASTIYEFELFVDLSTLSSTSGFFSFSLGGTATYNNLRLKTSTTKSVLITGSVFDGVMTSASAYQLITANTATVGTIVIKGLINVNGAGTIIPTITLSQASAGVVLTNSYCKLTKI